MKRLAMVVAAALAGFIAAIVHFTHAETAQTCLGDYPHDSSYSAQFSGSLTMNDTNHTLVVKHNGHPLTDQQVCLDTWMVGMSGMAMTTTGTQQSPGHYQVPFQFAMGGPWQGDVVITKKGGTQVSVPMTFDVGAGSTGMPVMTP